MSNAHVYHPCWTCEGRGRIKTSIKYPGQEPVFVSCKTCNSTGRNLDREDCVVCPYCGHIHEDSWEFFGPGFEYDDDTTEIGCHSCGKDFHVRLHVEYAYSSLLKGEV